MSANDSEISVADINKLALEISAPDGPGSGDWDMSSSHLKVVNDGVIKALRANNGNVPGELEGIPFLIITTTGAKTGKNEPCRWLTRKLTAG